MQISRKSFLKSALAAASFPYISGCITSKRCPDGKVRLACVGIGQQAWTDIREFEKTGLVEIAALCDTDLPDKVYKCASVWLSHVIL